MSAPAKEAHLGPTVIEWLRDRHWDIYQEVQVGTGGPRADIVGRNGSTICVVEMKLSFGLDVLAQARRWRQYANHVYVATPPRKSKDWDLRQFLLSIAEWKGIGVLEVVGDHWGREVRELQAPALNRKILPDLRDALRPEHKQSVAGTNGRHWTPFRGTVERLKELVRRQPGIALKQAIAEIEHHYANGASARQHLSDLIQRGIIEGLELRREGRSATLHISTNRGGTT